MEIGLDELLKQDCERHGLDFEKIFERNILLLVKKDLERNRGLADSLKPFSNSSSKNNCGCVKATPYCNIDDANDINASRDPLILSQRNVELSSKYRQNKVASDYNGNEFWL